jgi:ribosome-associated protein
VPVNRKTSISRTKTAGYARNARVADGAEAGKPKPGTPKPGKSKAGKPKAGAPKPKPGPREPKQGNAKSGTDSKPSLKSVVVDALADMKALEVKVLDVRGLTDIADFMVIASGTSDRHVRSVAQRVVEKTKEAGFRPHGVEGQQDSDWVLIDLSEMIVHVMLPRVREFYGLEKLWDMAATKRAARV